MSLALYHPSQIVSVVGVLAGVQGAEMTQPFWTELALQLQYSQIPIALHPVLEKPHLAAIHPKPLADKSLREKWLSLLGDQRDRTLS